MTEYVMPENPLSTGQEAEALKLPAPEEVIVTSRKVACDGNDAAGLGHPRVWLAISPDTGFVDCGYCDKRFVLDPNHVDADH
ncbi:Uncharacterized conserved protein, contains Zn-finger domain [Paracoccus seriniphilus]|uniref:Uncharacterized conserved protein, contains Zn-finger domain n=1 Tax=Paracoccus seriniphilus TaxID=184748 RepID=A0A239PN75_9RHOB|nr:Uncharacterized conserved protein, contains Zn-finger domain [Paracoccus seriniphilus]